MASLIHSLGGINNKIHEEFLRKFKEEYFNIMKVIVGSEKHF